MDNRQDSLGLGVDGTKTLFVRLAGCPFTCFYCDTKESLPLDSGTEYSIDEATKLIDSNLQNQTYKVNFTGGDPLIQHQAVAQLVVPNGTPMLTVPLPNCLMTSLNPSNM